MKIFYNVIKVVIFLALVLLSVSNVQTVSFHYLPGQGIDLPLIVLLLIFFIVGAVAGVIGVFGRLLALRSEAARLRSELKKEQKLRQSAPAAVGIDKSAAGVTAESKGRLHGR